MDAYPVMMTESGGVRRIDALDLLAQVSGLLASSFDLSATLPQVADLCVQELAQYCAIEARPQEGGLCLVEASSEPGTQLPREGSESLTEALARRGFESVLTLPLGGRTDLIGTFTLASRAANAFDETDRKLCSILALQIANALDQTSLFERMHRVADRLQRALLPASFPNVEGIELRGAYRPASAEAEVGGDWYDAFELPDGRVAISMGDVAGHGLEAATVMGEIRQAMRAAAIGERSPAAVLEQINGVINLRPGIGMVTAIFGFYRPPTRELTYAVAGHPPPVLTIAGGFSGFLKGGGVPLGVETSIDAVDWKLTLPPRSCVVFYTDGITEYSRDVLAGEEALLQASIRAFEADPENPAMAVQERIFDATANRDDAATLTLSSVDGVLPPEIAFSAIPLAAPIVRSMVHRFCDEQQLNDAERFSLITSVGEAVANAVEHAYRNEKIGEFFIRMFGDAETVTVEIEDHGRWRPFQQREERGRGIMLMHELMDRVRITSAQHRTILAMTLERAKARS